MSSDMFYIFSALYSAEFLQLESVIRSNVQSTIVKVFRSETKSMMFQGFVTS